VISVEEVEIIHDILIRNFGGAHGIRDISALESALARPFQTFDGNELYSDPIQKAAALLESILINHPFIDGNKRTGYTLMRLYLMRFQVDISATQDDKYELIIGVASGKYNIAHVIEWLRHHSIHV
jgi:death-on-curing protein